MTSSDRRELKVKAGVVARTIQVDYLARVEGEGALYIKTKGDRVEEVNLKIFEPPRFFEAFMQGRKLEEAPDITARICGICPIAYQMSSVNAMELALGVEIPRHIRQVRRLIYCGEWIESHALHVYLLHAPDFLGFLDALQFARSHLDILKRGLRLKKVGNELIRLLGGREIHPVNVRVGGFYSLPTKKQLLALKDMLKEARDDSLATVEWVSKFNFPGLEKTYNNVAANAGEDYPMEYGGVSSSSGIDIPASEYENYFETSHIPYTTSLQSNVKNDGSYLVGPVARYNLFGKKLPSSVQKVIQSIGFEAEVKNPFRSIIVRSLELLFACEEALRIIDEYDWEKLPAYVEVKKKKAIGQGVSEAPRGLLYHRYQVNEKGIIESAKIIAPTAQNQKTIEEDLFDFVTDNLSLSDQELTWKCEQAIRNYDPCISCSCHFLKLHRVNG